LLLRAVPLWQKDAREKTLPRLRNSADGFCFVTAEAEENAGKLGKDWDQI